MTKVQKQKSDLQQSLIITARDLESALKRNYGMFFTQSVR